MLVGSVGAVVVLEDLPIPDIVDCTGLVNGSDVAEGPGAADDGIGVIGSK